MMIGPRPEAVAEAEANQDGRGGRVSKAHLDFHTIRAPIDGVLDSLTCHPGQDDRHRHPVGEVVDTRQVFAAVWLPPASASSVRVGQPARVRPGDARVARPTPRPPRRRVWEDRFVGRVADPQTGNLPVRVLVDNPEGGSSPWARPSVSPSPYEGKTCSRSPPPLSSTWAKARS